MEHAQFWAPRALPQDKAAMWRLGPLRLWLARGPGEWRLGVERAEADARACNLVPHEVVPELADCTHYALGDGFRDFECAPAVPDRPVVLRPRRPLLIPPGQRATYYARVPVFVRIMAVNGSTKVTLKTLPSKILKDTWFGDSMEGVYSYGLAMTAERSPEELEPQHHHLVVPVDISNHADSDLQFERLSLRLEHVDIYAGREHMWTSRICVSHRSGNANSEIDYTTGAPDVERGLRLLHASDNKPSSLVRRSFGWIAQRALQLY